jgi:hypothetical protein
VEPLGINARRGLGDIGLPGVQNEREHRIVLDQYGVHVTQGFELDP